VTNPSNQLPIAVYLTVTDTRAPSAPFEVAIALA